MEWNHIHLPFIRFRAPHPAWAAKQSGESET